MKPIFTLYVRPNIEKHLEYILTKWAHHHLDLEYRWSIADLIDKAIEEKFN